MPSINLLSNPVLVSAPFITVNIGGYSLGGYSEASTVIDESGFPRHITKSYPNYVKSLDIVKINGAVNQYTLELVYAVQSGDDPNRIDKMLSAAALDRRIVFSYGDSVTPTFIYKEEVATITKVTSNVDISSSTISYTINAVGTAGSLGAGNFTFPECNRKPSEVIMELLFQKRYGLLEIFKGMRDKATVLSKKLIASDDKRVSLEKKTMSVLDYLNYLVSCMSADEDKDNDIEGRHKYIISTFDDKNGELGGPYFRVQKIAKSVDMSSAVDMYEIDIGYPSNNIVTSFTIFSNEAYSILYDFSGKIQQPQYSYVLNDKGEYDTSYNPALVKSPTSYSTSESDLSWWNQVTQYPIAASITLKGLLRPAMLMTYIKLDVRFYGRQHNSSGLYIITKETDSIRSSGCSTTLNILRVGNFLST